MCKVKSGNRCVICGCVLAVMCDSVQQLVLLHVRYFDTVCSSTNAYMLMYRRIDKQRNVCKFVKVLLLGL